VEQPSTRPASSTRRAPLRRTWFRRYLLRSITTEAGATWPRQLLLPEQGSAARSRAGRRIGPINRERLALLDACEAQAGDNPPPIEGLIRAFLAPVFSASHQDLAGFGRLFGRMHAEPGKPSRRSSTGSSPRLSPASWRPSGALCQTFPPRRCSGEFTSSLARWPTPCPHAPSQVHLERTLRPVGFRSHP